MSVILLSLVVLGQAVRPLLMRFAWKIWTLAFRLSSNWRSSEPTPMISC